MRLDPDNRLLHRMAIRRLEAEPIRDAILAVSGRLDDRMYGPSVAGSPDAVHAGARSADGRAARSTATADGAFIWRFAATSSPR